MLEELKSVAIIIIALYCIIQFIKSYLRFIVYIVIFTSCMILTIEIYNNIPGIQTVYSSSRELIIHHGLAYQQKASFSTSRWYDNVPRVNKKPMGRSLEDDYTESNERTREL
jgi:hypothetical protein